MAEAVQCTDRPTSPPYVFLASALHIHEVIARALRLGGGMYDELVISAKPGNHPAISAAELSMVRFSIPAPLAVRAHRRAAREQDQFHLPAMRSKRVGQARCNAHLRRLRERAQGNQSHAR